MLPQLKLVVRLQDIDSRSSELTREIAALPTHIAEIEKKLLGHQRKLDADRAALAANQKDRKRLEGEIQAQEQKISKLKGQSFEVKTNDQFRALQKEVEYCEQEIRRFEDRILELMSESEPLDRNVKTAEEALKAERQEVEGEKKEAERRTAEDRKQLDTLQAERKQIVAELDPGVYRTYERVRKNRRGIGVTEAVEGRCGACHMAMRLQFFQDLKRGDKIMTCESCGRILYYHPPTPIEDLTGEPAPALEQ